jgi:hypothetical protein
MGDILRSRDWDGDIVTSRSEDTPIEDSESLRPAVKKSVSSSYGARSGELEDDEAEVDVLSSNTSRDARTIFAAAYDCSMCKS